MNKKVLFLVIVCMCTLLSGCFQLKKSAVPNEKPSLNQPIVEKPIEQGSPPEKVEEPEQVVISSVESLMNEMTLEEKIGQLLIVGVEGTVFSDDINRLIMDYHVGGIILMGKNQSTAAKMLALINDSKRANAQNKIPLIFSVDEEGGRISRLPKDFPRLPTNEEIGLRNDPAFSFRVGQYLGDALNAFGYHMNFAPVLDINSNPRNPVIGNRSFGSTPEVVTELGIATMQGMLDKNIIPVVKHFPGHGDTETDSHLSLPVVNKTIKELKQLELIPFQKAIDENVDVIMVGHILFPVLDQKYPSSLSKAVITDLLRDQMNFDGVVITDDLTMGAIVNEYSVSRASVLSFLAGSDVLLVKGDYENEVNVFHALKSAVESGEISEARLNESVKRILMLKEKFSVTDEEREFIDEEKINKWFQQLMGNQ